MIIEDVESFKTWVAQALQPICNADPVALAKYVLALVKKDKPEDELRHICNDQLDVFLQDSTKDFVDRLFQFLSDSGYVAGARSPGGEPGTSDMQNAACAESVLQQKEKKEMDQKDLTSVKKLHKSIRAHDVPRVQQCLLEGVPVNARVRRETAVCIAVEEQQAEIVKALLDAGADPNQPLHPKERYDKMYPIELCAGMKDENQTIARLLLDAGATMQGRHGPIALHKAAEKNNKPLFELLLDRNADINALNHGDDSTPLDAACLGGTLEMVKFLFDHGAKYHVKRKEKLRFISVLTVAALRRQVDLIRLLIANGADPNEESMEQLTPLLALCQDQSAALEVVKVLVEAGADVNKKEERGFTCMHFLARYRPNTQVLKFLVEKGADMHAQGARGETPLYCACERVNIEYIAAALDFGVDVKTRDSKETGSHIMIVLWRLLDQWKTVHYHRVWTTVRLLIAAGCFLPPITMLRKIRDRVTEIQRKRRRSLSEKDISDVNNILAGVENQMFQPHSLSSICRLHVRSICKNSGRPVSETVEELYVPETVKNFLKFGDIFSVAARLKQSGGMCEVCKEYKDECLCELYAARQGASPQTSDEEGFSSADDDDDGEGSVENGAISGPEDESLLSGSSEDESSWVSSDESSLVSSEDESLVCTSKDDENQPVSVSDDKANPE